MLKITLNSQTGLGMILKIITKYLNFFLMVLKWVLDLKLVWRTRSTIHLIFSDLTILMMTIQILIGMIKG